MKNKLRVLALLVLATGGAQAGLVDIAQVPVLNIKGTGAVKPNLMLVHDNSGSMSFDFSPDAVAYGTNTNNCRTAATLYLGNRTCTLGDPPFASADFNQQYYNPNMRYTPALKANGSPYLLSDYGVASPWTAVRVDAFDADKGTSNLATGYKDLKWCTDKYHTNCKTNDATYTYPDGVYNYSTSVYGEPYYYTINVAEYCTDASLTTCKTVQVGDPAPSGYPVPAKVRWCADHTLATGKCQAKLDSTHKQPRFSGTGSTAAAYGTITIGASASSSSLSINAVTINEGSTAVAITDGIVTAPNGTSLDSYRSRMANDLAASINAKSGLTRPYLACVKSPTGTVPNCSLYGITLSTNYIVAVMPIVCGDGVTDKMACAIETDNSRAGWAITADVTSSPPTALIGLGRSTRANFTLASLKLGSQELFSSALSISAAASATTVANAIIAKVNGAPTSSVRAYAFGNAITSVCAAKSGSVGVCLVDSNSVSNGAKPVAGTMTNQYKLTVNMTAAYGADTLPVTTAALAAGTAIFARTNIVKGGVYPKGAERTDCAGTVCTYAEEMNNFAIWYAFYRTRDQMMKTAVGQAFAGVTDRYRVGLALMREINESGVSTALDPAAFSGAHRSAWFDKFYASAPKYGTPMRNAAHMAAKVFQKGGVVTELCQSNFLLLTTDGYWNGSKADDVLDNDNKENKSRFCTKAGGCVDDVNLDGAYNSLADVALYWYNGGSNTETVSLSLDLNENMKVEGLVPGLPGDNTHLHINTYTLGLGMDGIMNYDPNYDTSNEGDFAKIKAGATGCPWNGGGKYIWPNVLSSKTGDQQSRVDDLWHAAVNGRGKYMSAKSPGDVVKGITEALNNMSATLGAASAAATSTPNVSQEDNDIFSDTYTTVKWFGELSAQKIDINTGEVSTTTTWVTSATLGKQVNEDSDSRTIYMFDSASRGLKPFLWASLDAGEKDWFTNRCTDMSQCTGLPQADRDIVNDGENLVNWLRGQQQHADDKIYRTYSKYAGSADSIPIVLGDIVSSRPAYLRDPRKAYTLTGYTTYKSTQKARTAMVYTAANDGMLHAFDASNGEERWAYMPRVTMPKLAAQASIDYASNHQFSTDGSPELADVVIDGAWRTVLVAGFGAGGRGYYALDVTEPLNPRALWEICDNSSICANTNPHIGLTLGNPQIGMWNNKWVVFVTSGYNNVAGVAGGAGGDGKGHLFIVDVATGAILKDVSTGSGSTSTPSGLARITAITKNPSTDPVVTYVYGGDNLGQMWRFDLTDASGIVASPVLMGNAGTTQPITTRPDVTICMAKTTDDDDKVTAVPTRVVLFGTGRLLGLDDTHDTNVQSLYLIKDKDSATGNPISNLNGATMVEQVLTKIDGNTTTYKVSSNEVNLAEKDGWYIDLDKNVGERMNLDPKIINGGANFVTNIPGESSACSVGGSSNVYQVGVCTGSLTTTDMIAGSTLSSTSAAVGFVIVRLESGQMKMISTLATGKMVTKQVDAMQTKGSRKVGWRRMQN